MTERLTLTDEQLQEAIKTAEGWIASYGVIKTEISRLMLQADLSHYQALKLEESIRFAASL